MVVQKLNSVTLKEDPNENEFNDSTDLFSKLVRIVEEDGQICMPMEKPEVNRFMLWIKID